MKLFFNKEFYKNYLIYLIPISCSFLFYWKIGEASFWFDELVTLKTVSNTNPYIYISTYYDNQLHPPLYFIVLKFYLGAITFLDKLNHMLLTVVYMNAEFLQSAGEYLHIPKINFFEILESYLTINIWSRLNIISESSIRLISAFFFTATNVVIFDYFKKNKLIIIGVVTSLLIGTNTKLIYYGQEARPYALFSLLFILVLREFDKTKNLNLNLRNFKRLFILNFLMLTCHYYSVFVVLSEVFFLSFINRKNKKIVFSGIFSLFALILLFLGFYECLNVSKLSFLSDFRFSDLKPIYENVLGYLWGWGVFIFCSLFLLIKIIFKKKSYPDSIVLNASLFFASLLFFVYLFSSLRPIFNARYLIFLSPFLIIIIAGICYSASEIIFLFVKNKNLKQIAVNSVFLLFSIHLIVNQTFYHFYIYDYYQTNKYYPMKAAYTAITHDKDYKYGVNYILEEYMGTYFKFYDQKYDLQQALEVDPATSNDEKEKKIKAALDSANLKTFYYIRVRHSETSQENKLILIKNFTKKLIFKEFDIEVYKFLQE